MIVLIKISSCIFNPSGTTLIAMGLSPDFRDVRCSRDGETAKYFNSGHGTNDEIRITEPIRFSSLLQSAMSLLSFTIWNRPKLLHVDNSTDFTMHAY